MLRNPVRRPTFHPARSARSSGRGLTLPGGAIFKALAPGLLDTIGLLIISGTWPNCVVQAIPGGPVENFGPFAGAAMVNMQDTPEVISNQFFWGAKGYAFYNAEQSISSVKRILTFLNSDAYVDYIYVGAEPLTVNGDSIAAIFGASI